MLKTVMLPNIFVETVIHFIFQVSQISKEKHLFELFCNIRNVFTVTFEQFNESFIISSNKTLLTSNFFLYVHIIIVGFTDSFIW